MQQTDKTDRQTYRTDRDRDRSTGADTPTRAGQTYRHRQRPTPVASGYSISHPVSWDRRLPLPRPDSPVAVSAPHRGTGPLGRRLIGLSSASKRWEGMGSTVQFPRVSRRQAKVTGKEGSDMPSVVGSHIVNHRARAQQGVQREGSCGSPGR